MSFSALRELGKAISAEAPRAVGQTRTATVVETREGVPYVEVSGSGVLTPIEGASAALSIGDIVQVTQRGGRLYADGNYSRPATDDAKAAQAYDRALSALAESARASAAADAAEVDAARAHEAADAAQSSADDAADAAAIADQKAADAAAAAATADQKAVDAGNAASAAQASADKANTYSNAALDQLGVVQDVAGILTWASEQGAFVRTSDTAIVDGKVYFTLDGTDYTPVVEPDAAQLSTYYELDMSGSKQAMNEYILAHLAVTGRGLWVLPSGKGNAVDEQHAAGYKMLLAADGSYLYDSAGVLVRSDTASGTDFASSRDWHVGGEDAYIFYDASEGTVTIGGDGVVLGSGRTLSELVAEADVPRYDHDYSLADGAYTFTARMWRAGTDLAPQYPPAFFWWRLRTEGGETDLGTGLAVQVQALAAGYHGTVVGGVYDALDAQLADSDGYGIVDSDGYALAVHTIWEV